MKSCTAWNAMVVAVSLCACVDAAASPAVRIAQALDIAPVWSGHPVGFCLLTAGQRQYVAYYDAQRRMTVAARTLDEAQWQFQILPPRLGWDSHNYVTMALDAGGYLHLSGNMHCAKLVYFRSRQPYEIGSLERIDRMVGSEEDRCTYPRFYDGPGQSLVFTYRIGRSGNGEQIFNTFDVSGRTWRRLLDKPLLDGRGRMNAYPSTLVRGPDARWHLCWMWRDTPDCATNHHVGYARSADLVHWEAASGESITLPITLETQPVHVDPTPPGQGLINVSQAVGFDGDGRPIISYHKYDAAGKSQIYNARWERDHWQIYQATDWDYRWQFSGGGSIPSEITCGPVHRLPDGSLVQDYHHPQAGSGTWQLDAATLKATCKVAGRPPMPHGLAKVESTYPDMHVHLASDSGGGPDAQTRYVLRWETLPPNRDHPRPGAPPPPSMLRVYKLVEP